MKQAATNAARIEALATRKPTRPTPAATFDFPSNSFQIQQMPQYYLSFEDEDEDIDVETDEEPKRTVNIDTSQRKEFNRAMQLIGDQFDRAIEMVAKQTGLPTDHFEINFDLWPFNNNIPVDRLFYDAQGVPTHELYHIELDELFPPAKMPIEKDGDWDDDEDVTELLHNTLVRRAKNMSPPIAVARGVIVHFETAERSLAYYFTVDDWKKGVDQQVRSLAEAGALILTTKNP